MKTLSSYVKEAAAAAGFKFIQVHPSDVNFQLKMADVGVGEFIVVMYPSTYQMQIEGGRFNGRVLYNAQIIELCAKSETSGTRANLDELYIQKLDNRLTDMGQKLEDFLYRVFDCAPSIEVKNCAVNDYINKYNDGVDGLTSQITCELW